MLPTNEKRLLFRRANLKDEVNLLCKKLFSSSSEKRVINILGQLNLFNEAELEQDFNVAEVEELAATIPTGSPKKKKTKATDAERFNGIPVIKKYLDIPEDEQTCPVCNNPLVKIGEEFVRRKLIFIPAKLKAVEIYNFNYSCPECRKREIPVVKKGIERKPDMLYGMTSADTAARVMYQKFFNSLPYCRHEKD